MNQRIVIAGANGYLARNSLCRLFKEETNTFYLVSSKEPSVNYERFGSRIQYVRLGIEEYGKILDFIDLGCDIAVNFSWIATRGEGQENERIQKQNEEYSLALLQGLINKGCRKFIQIGSMAEYGTVQGVISEETKCHPITAYAKSKLNCAKRMREICNLFGVQFYELRMGSMYGNYMETDNLLGYLCSELSQGRHVRLKTNCMQDWEYTHVDDFAEILFRYINTDIEPGIYNISNGDTHSLRYFINLIEEKYGTQNYVIYGNIDQGVGCQSIRCDNRKVRKYFDKNDFINFENGISSVIQYYST